MPETTSVTRIAERFRGFLPVVVDVETGGFDCERDALLEIAVVVIGMDAQGFVFPHAPVSTHVEPFPGANLDPRALEITGIDVDHPFRNAREERAALDHVFAPVRVALRAADCQRAILVGHNAGFDLSFLNAAVRRTGHKRNPFHPFSNFDTVTLAGLAYGQTVLARAVAASGVSWDANEAHSAVYDTERTAELFCKIVNRWKHMSDLTGANAEPDIEQSLPAAD
ncbi:MAG: ribonuclease T [Dokdonella sp.]|uniref:ribonuclease T n=1 Tax=Dokdonella sp. TaxID=2291710 RepID=UPI003BB0B9C9